MAAAAARSDHSDDSDDDEDVVLVGGDSDNDDGTDANNGLVCMVLSSGNAKHNHTTHLVVLTDRQINGRQRKGPTSVRDVRVYMKYAQQHSYSLCRTPRPETAMLTMTAYLMATPIWQQQRCLSSVYPSILFHCPYHTEAAAAVLPMR